VYAARRTAAVLLEASVLSRLVEYQQGERTFHCSG
jgi:hypothetical protein